MQRLAGALIGAVVAVLLLLIAAGVLLPASLPEPSDYAAEAERVLWTLIGVAIAVLVMLLGNLLAKRSARSPTPAASWTTSAVTASG